MLEISDDFIESITGFGCALAKHRGSDTLEVKDLQLHLGIFLYLQVFIFADRNWNIRIPGYASEIKPYKRAPVTEAHKYRLGLVKRSRFQHQKQVEKQKKKEQQQEAAKNAQK